MIYKAIKNRKSSDDIIVGLLFLYLGIVYFSKAISNTLLVIIIFLYLMSIIRKKIKIDLNRHFIIRYLLIITPFVLTIISTLLSDNVERGIRFIWLRIPILIIPFIVLSIKIKKEILLIGSKFFILLSVIASVISISNAYILFNDKGAILNPNYADLVTVIQHPYFGIFQLISLVLLIEVVLYKNNKNIFFAIPFLIIGIILSTSRLVYLLAILLAVYYIIIKLTKQISIPLIIIVLSVFSTLIITNNSLKNKVLRTVEYKNSPRLWLWNNAYKVLKNSKHPLFGVGIGDYYTNTKDPYFFREKEKGTMGYNPHNQYLEFILTNGVIGLLFIVSMGTIFYIIYRRSKMSVIIFLIIASFTFTENILNRQFGVQLYSFFIPLLLAKYNKSDSFISSSSR
ncbi:MAG: O-antigen ligase family protein [Flavobacteriaceae bacterium]